MTALGEIYWIPDADRPRHVRPVDPRSAHGYGVAVDTLYRLLAGETRSGGPREEQRLADSLVLAHMLWNAWEALHHAPERIAYEVGKLFSSGPEAGPTPEAVTAARSLRPTRR